MKQQQAPSFGFAKFLSWVTLSFILISSVLVSVFLANKAREIIYSKQQDFAMLLANNLNHQIYQRFVLPTSLVGESVALRQPDQYKKLDLLVRSNIHGLQVDTVRIFYPLNIEQAEEAWWLAEFDNPLYEMLSPEEKAALQPDIPLAEDGTVFQVSYSTNEADLGQFNRNNRSVKTVYETGKPVVEVISGQPFWHILFSLSTAENTFVLRTTYVMRIEGAIGQRDTYNLPLLGVLEMTQDITQDTKVIVGFLWLIIAAVFVSSIALFLILQFYLKRAERALAERFAEQQRLESELYQHEKLASMGRIISSIAHEIRNPLGIIRSSSELMLSNTKKGVAPNTRLLEAIHSESKRLSQTVNDFLDYARPQQLRKRPVELNSLFEQAFSFLTSEFEQHNIVLSQKIQPKLTVQGDKDFLYRALYNILSNAIQAVGTEGTIAVTAYEQKGLIEIIVDDSGSGFAPEYMEKAFDPFFTTKADGTGLGLPIVKNIISNHDGMLTLENNPAGGARVRIMIPAG